MNRTLLGVVSLAGAMLAAIWLVHGPLQPSESQGATSAVSSNQRIEIQPAGSAATSIAPPANLISGEATDPRLLPASSVNEVLALSHDFSETHAAYALAARADEATLRELIADAQKIERRNDRVALTSIFILRYGEIDPAAALEFVLESGFDSKRDHLFVLFNSWSKVNLDGALDATIALDTIQDRQVAAEAILLAYSDTEPLKVAGIVARLMAAGVSGSPAPRLAPEAPSGTPQRALATAMALPRDQATVLVANIGRSWALEDPEAAFAYSRTIEDASLRRRMVGGVFYSWIGRDPERVFDLLDDQLTTDERNAVINNNGFIRFAQADPDKALDLSSRIANSSSRADALFRVFSSWAEVDPAAAALALDSVESPNGDALRRIVATEYARQAPADALEWASRVGDGQPPPEVIAEVARRDPSLALDAALSMPTPELRAATIGQISQFLAGDNVTMATEFWQRLPAEHRAPAANGIVQIWAVRDPEAASSWVTGMSPEPERQQALRTLLRTLAYTSENSASFPQLLGMLDSNADRDTIGYNRVAALVRNGRRDVAESELNRLSLSPEYYRRARQAIDGAEIAE